MTVSARSALRVCCSAVRAALEVRYAVSAVAATPAASTAAGHDTTGLDAAPTLLSAVEAGLVAARSGTPAPKPAA